MAFSHNSFRYHEWLSKTNFSFLVGASHPEDLLKASLAYNYDSLCINDLDGVYGIARTYNDRNFLAQNGNNKLKLNYGSEIHLQADHQRPILQQNTLALNALNRRGYKNLCRILSELHVDSKDKGFLPLRKLLSFDLEGLFAIIPMRGGLDYFAKNHQDLINLKEALNNRLYFAKTRTFSKYCDQKIHICQSLAKQYEIRQIISQDAYFAHRDQKNFHDLITAIKQNMVVSEALDHYFPNGERSLHNKREIFKIYSSFPDFKNCLIAMEELNEQSQFCLSELKYQYPQEMIPEGYSSQQYLEKLAWEGARTRYGDHLPEKVIQTISKELDLIEDLKFADYFLTVWDIVAWARAQGILCQGRGSAANSAVCFSLGITSCDPSLFDLLFERFVSKERGDPPDIDVDFEHERREEVIQYIYKRYGRRHAAMVANIITFRSKGSVRAVGKALGAPESLLKTASNILGTVMHRRDDVALVIDQLKNRENENQLPWSLWKEYSQKIKGFPRHMGLHSGGFVISHHEIADLVPTEPATMEGRTIIQWAKDDIEELGFFKIDILALGMLTALRKGFDLVQSHYKQNLNLYNLPAEDAATYAMIQKANTVGVFQIESRAQMSMLPRLKPKTFYDLVIEIAIIRPGPIQGNVIHPYLKRRDGLVPIEYPHSKVKPILSKTLGVVIFQEQLMRIAIALGDFSPGEANELRKQIGTWNSKTFSRNLSPYIDKLFTGLKRNGVSPDYIKQMVEQMKGFAHYGFPESHSISFAFIAYASCYLKCHYPAAFFTAVLNSQPMGFYSPHDLLQTALQEGVTVLPISVNHSTWDHQLEQLPQKDGRPPVFAIRLGFRIVSGLSKKAIESLEESRAQVGTWDNFNHFIDSTKIYRDDYSAIAAANGFHCFGLDRIQAIWKAEAVPLKAHLDDLEDHLNIKPKSPLAKTQMDFKAFGTSLGIHPVELIKQKYWNYPTDPRQLVTSKDIQALVSLRHTSPKSPTKKRQIICVFGMVRIRQAPPTAKGMVFVTLQDESGFINIAFTPQVYKKYYKEIEGAGFLCVQGQLQNANESHSILVNHVHTLAVDKIEVGAGKTKSTSSQSNIKRLIEPRRF